jgi:hypothetical protein
MIYQNSFAKNMNHLRPGIFLQIFLTLFLGFSVGLAKTKKPIEGFQKAKFSSSYKSLKSVFPKLGPAKKKGAITHASLKPFDIVGKTAVLDFYFFEDRFYLVAAAMPIKGLAKTVDEDEFNRVKELLTTTYGDPTDISTPRGNIGGSDTTQAEIRMGSITWMADWEDEANNNKIRLQLAGKDMNSFLILMYGDTKLQDKAKEATNKQQSSDL